VNTRERLDAFVEAELDRLDTRDGNILNAYANQIRDLIRYLEVTAAEYDQATRAWFDSLEKWNAEVLANIEAHGGGSSEETAEGAKLRKEVAEAGLIVYLRIETFYLFAKILIDKLARLIPHYFGSARGVGLRAHSSIADHDALPRFAKQKGLTAVPPSLAALIEEVGRRVSDYRDRWITHAYSPRTLRGIAFMLDTQEAAIMTTPLYPRDDSETSTQSDTPRTLLPLIGSYVIEPLDYFESNRDKAAKVGSAE
jgi:hypothetical protein